MSPDELTTDDYMDAFGRVRINYTVDDANGRVISGSFAYQAPSGVPMPLFDLELEEIIVTQLGESFTVRSVLYAAVEPIPRI